LLCGGIPCAQDRCSLAVGFPVHPMLANPSHSLEQVEQFVTAEDGRPLEAVAEWKYDGMRCQAHWDGSTTKLFSRHLLDTTEQYPDAVKYLSGAIQPGIESFIVDAEIVGVVSTSESDSDSEFRLLPFQDLSTRRGTKQDTGRSVQIRIYAFDLLYLNGVSLIKQPLYERQRILRQHFKETAGFAFVSSITLARFDEPLIQNFLKESVRGGAEGLMIKLTGRQEEAGSELCTSCKTFGYESGTRGQLWLKLKRDYMTDFADTIDVVPIGAWHGTGRKAEKGFLSPILLAVYDEDEGVYRSISRCMSFSDAMYNSMREFYFRGTPYPAGVGIDDSPQPQVKVVAADADADQQGGEQRLGAEDSDQEVDVVDVESDENDNDETCERVNCFPGRPSSAYIVTNESPSIWFKPSEVFEVSFADLSLSRVHTAGAGLVDDPDGRGIALRFPRFKRRRPDKSIEQATTTEEVAHLFCKQSKSYK
jgi:DNA ligase-1